MYISPAVRRRVAQDARHRCAYCQTAERIIGPLLEIDHIIPEAKGGSSDMQNLTLACPVCNSHKADKTEAIDPETGEIVSLFHPRKQTWQDHFVWDDEVLSFADRRR